MDDITERMRRRHCERPEGNRHATHMIHGGGCYGCEIERLRTEGAAKDAAIDAMLAEIPTGWCDPLLSGDGGLPIPATCPDIERFIKKLRERLERVSGRRGSDNE